MRPDDVRIGILYAYALITPHGVRRAANEWLPQCLQAGSLAHSNNGWGAVFLAGDVRQAFRSQVPLLAQSAPTKAYIFWLEAIAQVLSVICVQPFAEHALQKGYSKDAKFTKLLGAFWSWVAAESLSLSFHRVASAANSSDGISRGDLFDASKNSSSSTVPTSPCRPCDDGTLKRGLVRGLGAAPPLKHANEGGNSAREWLKSRCSAYKPSFDRTGRIAHLSDGQRTEPSQWNEDENDRRARASSGVFVTSLSCSARVHVGTKQVQRTQVRSFSCRLHEPSLLLAEAVLWSESQFLNSKTSPTRLKSRCSAYRPAFGRTGRIAHLSDGQRTEPSQWDEEEKDRRARASSGVFVTSLSNLFKR